MKISLPVSGQDKKTWIIPQLIIIGRGRPEESVLLNCKCHNQPNTVQARATKTNCNNTYAPNCGACHTNGNNAS